MSKDQVESAHTLPMAWSLHQTARLVHFIERCGRGECAACGRIRTEVERRGDAEFLPTRPAATEGSGS